MSLKMNFQNVFKVELVIICPFMQQVKKKNTKFNMIKFANLISKNSKTQVIIA